MKRIFLLFFLLMLVSGIPGCSRGKETESRNRTVYAAETAQADGLIWKTNLSMFGSIRWYDPATGANGSLHSDPLCTHDLSDQDTCPLAMHSVMNIAVVDSTVYFLSWEHDMSDDWYTWYAYDFPEQKMIEVASIPDGALPTAWCVSGDWLWYARWGSSGNDAEGGDNLPHFFRVPTGGKNEPEEVTPEGFEEPYITFYVWEDELYILNYDADLIGPDGEAVAEHVTDFSDGWIYIVKNSEPIPPDPDMPDAWNANLRVYDLWRMSVDGEESEAVLFAESCVLRRQFVGDCICTCRYAPVLLYSWLPSRNAPEEERIYVYDYSGGKTLLYDVRSGELKWELAPEGISVYGVDAVGEDWVAFHGLDYSGFERVGDKLAVEGLTQEEIEKHVGYYLWHADTGEITEFDFGFID